MRGASISGSSCGDKRNSAAADRLKEIVYWTPVALAAAVRKHPEFRTHVELKELRQMAAAQMEEFEANVEKAIADLLRDCLPEDAAQS